MESTSDAQALESNEAQPKARTSPVLEVTDLSTIFQTQNSGTVRAVDDVSIRLEAGQVTGVVGESGSGKSTLARTIMRLLPRGNTRFEGSVKFNGQELLTLTNRQMRRYWGGDQMSMVFQDPLTSLNPVMRVGAQLAEAVNRRGRLSASECRSRSLELLRSVGIPSPDVRLRQYPHQLSGGMRQRVVLAIALACDPELLVADEPTTALDVTVQAQIMRLLRDQQQARGLAMILITHDLDLAAEYCDQILVMYGGQIVERMPSQRLHDGSARSPYTHALQAARPSFDQPPHTTLQAIPGRPPGLDGPVSKGCRFAERCQLAQPECLVAVPPLASEQDDSHAWRCFFPVGTDRGDHARAENLRRGATATGLPLVRELVPLESL